MSVYAEKVRASVAYLYYGCWIWILHAL